MYRERFEELGIPAEDHPHELLVWSRDRTLSHCHGMLDKVVAFVRKNQTEKAFRWLGFIQGCLWAGRVYSIDEMANHNRPSE
jgi:hypothetical protein